jgi:chaperonin GroEL (HSP60 family)
MAIAIKHVMFRAAAREKVLPGATQLADAARITLGPKSRREQEREEATLMGTR